MADLARIGSDVSAGTYRCTSCGYTIHTRSVTHLRPCLSCGGPNEWEAITGGDSADDQYPDRAS
jgi:ribosomal protein L37AE/L43A